MLNWSVINLFKCHRVRLGNFCRQGYWFSSGWCHLERNALPEKDASAVWRMTQHRDSGSCSFSSFPTPTSPRLPLSSSNPLWPPYARTQGKWLQMNFVCWPFKKLSVSLAVSPTQTEALLLFRAGCYMGFFLALLLYAGEPSLGFKPHTSQGVPVHWNVPVVPQLQTVGAQPALSCLFPPPYQSHCGEVVSSVCLSVIRLLSI